MSAELMHIYKEIDPEISDLYVVPLIPFEFKKSSYLYRLYSQIIEESNIRVHSISVFGHWKFVLGALFKQKSILHYHWLEFQDNRALSGMLWKLICIWKYKLFGGKIVWTVHNLKPHDGRYLKMHRKIAHWMGKKSSVVLVHCKSSVETVSEYFKIPVSKIKVLEHPSFPAEKLDKNQCRKVLSEQMGVFIPGDDHLFLVFGQISHYKGIPEIIDAFKDLNQENAHLLIAGSVKKGNQQLHDELMMYCSETQNLYLRDTFIDEQTLALIHNAADTCVFNHKDIMASGSIEMARSYDLPILCPPKGCIQDYKDDKTHFFNSRNELEAKMRAIMEAKTK